MIFIVFGSKLFPSTLLKSSSGFYAVFKLTGCFLTGLKILFTTLAYLSCKPTDTLVSLILVSLGSGSM